MAHEIETYEDKAAFVSAREDAWHQLGTVVDSAMTAEEALSLAHLTNWNVRKTALHTIVSNEADDYQSVEVPDRYATVRDNPFESKVDVLGVVGSKYEPIQNEAHAGLLDALVDSSGAHFETAGSLRGGREVFLTMKLPETMTIGDDDNHDLYIAALNSHDGMSAFRFMVTPVRIVCKNTQTMAEKSAKSTFSVRHTKNGAEGIMQQARDALDLTYKFLDTFSLEANKMIEKQITDDQFNQIVSALYPVDEDATDLIKSRNDEIVGSLWNLYANADTQKNIRGTAWAGYQSVVEYLDHLKVRNFGYETEQDKMKRAFHAVVGDSGKVKAKAFSMFAGV